MNGYLVLARCAIDDIPMRLFDSHPLAVAFAAKATRKDVCKVARDCYGLDTSVVYGIDIVAFKKGIPDGGKHVKSFV